MSFNQDLSDLRARIDSTTQFKIFVLILLCVLLFAPVLIELVQTWSTSPDYSHGFFVIPIALFMLWRKRDQIFTTPPSSSWIWFSLSLLAVCTYIIALITSFHSLTYLSMIIIIFSLFFFLAGLQITKIVALAILFLLFMFPIPSSLYILITNPLKLMITSISAWIIQLFGFPVYQDGNLLFFANTQLEVAEACSGIRSLYSFIMLSCVFALLCSHLTSKMILIASTIPLAILVNIIRVSGTGILANFYGPEVAQGFFHEFTGFILFIIGLIVLFAIYYLLENRSIHGGSRRLHE
ncbi:MAG: exosortase [Deltaproteobacteria bacterium]|nr:exosortase [Deltaproteobacteria bacterium]